MTQEQLSERSDLSVDSVRRLEAGTYSPRLQALRKLAAGLDLTLSTLLAAFEQREPQRRQEIMDLLATRSPGDLDRALRMLAVFFDVLGGRTDRPDDDEPDDDEPDDDEPSDGEPE